MMVLHGGTFIPVIVRNYTHADFDAMIALQAECFPPPFPEELWWNEQQLENHVRLFPEGAICVEYKGKIIGSMTGLRVNFNPDEPKHRWEDVTDNGYIRTHEPAGDTLYIVDICISPEFRKAGLGKLMMQAIYQLAVKLDVKRVLGGGRMPGYGKFAGEMSAEQYVEKIVQGSLKDPVITFLLRCGRMPVTLIENYLDDEESHNYALLMEWKNPFRMD
ncbi:GNAT family N-acetyltransferase [Sporosarcina thermotolerans]|uniref:GNAT family N-acetyltransferase n=1 Tax=Sporosarcina thermotolerans TaxID=633404 RepID=A0AAW9A608_9BACL|nr:GNAT family N-acetyltransferase [Sporosarcina thermotolerans]MDW0116682.1 GNAT family N-acetyltransferase [Sporosarcina thermotolerans]WHT49855.1 GNAT family N-acetyltransferase [Sporosarcina thermotolerans]